MVPCFCLTAPAAASYSVLLKGLQALQRRAAGVRSPARTEMARFVEMAYTLNMLNVTPFPYLCRMRRPTVGDDSLQVTEPSTPITARCANKLHRLLPRGTEYPLTPALANIIISLLSRFL